MWYHKRSVSIETLVLAEGKNKLTIIKVSRDPLGVKLKTFLEVLPLAHSWHVKVT